MSCSGSESECVLSERKQIFLRDVEHLHERTESDLDDLVERTDREKLELHAEYCNCQDWERLSRFCKKVLSRYISDGVRHGPSKTEAITLLDLNDDDQEYKFEV